MKKYFVWMSLILLLSGCQKIDTTDSELNDYYISMTKSTEEGEKVYFQNVAFDFENMNTIESEVLERNSQYPLLVFDKDNNRYLYSAKYENGDDHLFIYDLNSNQEKHIDLGIWGINYILVRENDYIVVAVKNFTHILALFSIDKDTYSFKEIELPKNLHDDMSVWQVEYIPQNDGLVIQAYSDEEQYKIYDEWNSEAHEFIEDIDIPYYHYILVDEEIEYLFKLDMPNSHGMLSNGKEILIAVSSINKDKKHVIRYNLESKEMTTEEHIKTLNSGFYLSDDGKYIYAMGDNIHKFDTTIGEDTILDIEFPFDGYNSNYTLVKKP